MTIPVEFVVLFLGVVLTILGWLIKYIIGEIKDIKGALANILDHFGKLNGRVGKTETWCAMHEKSDDDRIEHLEKSADALWEAVREQS